MDHLDDEFAPDRLPDIEAAINGRHGEIASEFACAKCYKEFCDWHDNHTGGTMPPDDTLEVMAELALKTNAEFAVEHCLNHWKLDEVARARHRVVTLGALRNLCGKRLN